jgi:hypothetical protein
MNASIESTPDLPESLTVQEQWEQRADWLYRLSPADARFPRALREYVVATLAKMEVELPKGTAYVSDDAMAEAVNSISEERRLLAEARGTLGARTDIRRSPSDWRAYLRRNVYGGIDYTGSAPKNYQELLSQMAEGTAWFIPRPWH